MSLVSGLAIYFIIWWLVLFTILPIGAHSPHELGQDVDSGHAPSAPVTPRLWMKALVTTVVAGVIFSGMYYARVNNLITLDMFPGP